MDDTTIAAAKPAPRTARFTNISSLGALDIPGVGIIAAGATAEIDDPALAEQFTNQPDNWKKAAK